MNIGLLAYHSVCNFGANLQLLSTFCYLKKNGYNPIVINWIPESLENRYKNSNKNQVQVHIDFRKANYIESDLCRSASDIALVIKKENIEAVIVGSDAVAQHHPLLTRIHFPSSRIFYFVPYSEDCLFPNAFWGTFNDYLEKPVPVAVLSASCQNSPFTFFSSNTKIAMKQRILAYKYVSARDSWTSEMYKYITNNAVQPNVTPDPVFASNYNIDNIPSKEDILAKYGLSEKYLLFSFFNNHKVTESWLKDIQYMANKDGIECVAMAFPAGICFKHPFEHIVDIPLPPLDWYALIKYSSGYIGHNMHPIVVCLHNSVPFFSFDNYGITKFGVFTNEESSKIYHILDLSGFLNNRVCDCNLLTRCPKAEYVYNKILTFDKDKCIEFSENYYKEYLNMMTLLINSIKQD